MLLLCACYADGGAVWGGVLHEIGARQEGDVLVLGDGVARVRPVEDAEWDGLSGGNVPALVPDGGVPPVAVLADIMAVYGAGGPLLVDLVTVPGRGVRVLSDRLGEVLADLSAGRLVFDDLVREMDRCGVYQGDGGRPALPAPPAPRRRSFPALPAVPGVLLVRTSFEDDPGWSALLDELGGTDAKGRIGADLDLDPDEFDDEDFPLEALVVDDRAFEGLHPGQVPALVPPGDHVTLVVLADNRTFTDPGRPLTAVDLHATPGQAAVLPSRHVGSLVCNLDIGNMDFYEFVAEEGVEPWWEQT
ncbi:DUF6924 domain-containing protein [Actinacidiphila yeochonensis]|uniref:DUF6924 domain-containing protein n=1 Tax=Actinacidiphila yeochonensis TaxID=89050 RepID=UPI001E5CB3EE|nr:hypothetical protein [Actinacidiphila yeochonensis]